MLQVENTFSTAQETESQWQRIRVTERSIRQLRDVFSFLNGAQYVGQPLPVAIDPETMEQIEMLLTAQLVQSQNQRKAVLPK